MNWAGTLHPPLAACPFRYQRARKTDEETGLVDTKVPSQLGNESCRASVGGLYSDPRVLFVDSAGLCLPVPAPDAAWRLSLASWRTSCKEQGSFHPQGAVLCKPSCLASWEGRLTHLSSPGGPSTLCSYLPRFLPEVTSWPGFSHAPSGPPKSTSITRH